MSKVSVVLCILMLTVRSEDVRKRREGRQGKLFTFNTLNEDIKIDLDFTVPFLSIPVKKTMNSAYGLLDFPTININPASLALGGAVVLGTSIAVPFILKYYAHETNERYGRILDNAEFSADAVLDFAHQMLSGSHGLRGCPLRVACWAAQQEYANPREIINQIVNNRLLASIVNSSAVEDAMISGRHGRSCSSYAPCPLQEHHVPMLMTNLAILTNTPGFK
ncbi:uncharacterized protein LOC118275704 [Spodoptera frugiperda]|uniref:Uncharacterized protein LOC118275704 n=2 Tax=Spodoptera frugiperda TaxID=7108 RepID=A0A9R0DDX9_SPOFR|nr:uncharacterized protein LOC118275704 [Spodoptera frugiperda]